MIILTKLTKIESGGNAKQSTSKILVKKQTFVCQLDHCWSAFESKQKGDRKTRRERDKKINRWRERNRKINRQKLKTEIKYLRERQRQREREREREK